MTTLPSTSLGYSEATIAALESLRSQLNCYAVTEIVGRHYLITKNDLIVTNRLGDVDLGDIVQLNRVKELGSKDFTIKGDPYVSNDYYHITATVVEQPKGPFTEIIKKKKRNRRKKRITHKQTYTVLRVREVEVAKLQQD